MRSWLLALLLLISHGAWATAQIPEVIEVDGKNEMLFTEPFSIYLANHRTEFQKLERLVRDTCTGSWRGYQGHWHIKDEKLYLESLFANPCSDTPDPIPLTTFFPGSEGPVHAEWFTGKLIVPLGKRLQYVHMGYQSKYERYLVIEVERGRVVKREVTSEKPE